MLNLPDQTKQVGDTIGAVAGLSSFSAATLSTLQGVSLILAIVASGLSIVWFCIRFYDRYFK